MKFSIITLFPELFTVFLSTSMVGRATSRAIASVEIVDLREFGLGKHRSVDDTPYGGGSGMVLRAPPIVEALEAVDARAAAAGAAPAHRILLTPQGAPLRQPLARALAQRSHVALVCGRYEGFDERVRSHVHEEISLGDFVLTGGEIPAMAIIEAAVRLLPGVLGNEESAASESFSEALGGALEYPHYTRPPEFRGAVVPEVLLSGDHARVEAWRREQAQLRTRLRRPELDTTPAASSEAAGGGKDEER